MLIGAVVVTRLRYGCNNKCYDCADDDECKECERDLFQDSFFAFRLVFAVVRIRRTGDNSDVVLSTFLHQNDDDHCD